VVRREFAIKEDGLDLKHATNEEMCTYVLQFEEEYEKLKERLLYQELIVQRTKDKIEKMEVQIQKIKDKIRKANQRQSPRKDLIDALRTELKSAGFQEPSKMFDLLDEISQMPDSRMY
jgi:chromosome segregation ATPase